MWKVQEGCHRVVGDTTAELYTLIDADTTVVGVGVGVAVWDADICMQGK
jgi:hypothetical protein